MLYKEQIPYPFSCKAERIYKNLAAIFLPKCTRTSWVQKDIALKLMNSQKVVTPVKTGVQMLYNFLKRLDSGFRRNDGLQLRKKTVFYYFLRVHQIWIYIKMACRAAALSNPNLWVLPAFVKTTAVKVGAAVFAFSTSF